MKTSPLASLVALNTITHAQTDAISMPIRLLYGSLNKVTTPVMVGSGNEEIGQSIDVVVDYGSADFWVCCFIFGGGGIGVLRGGGK